MNECYNKPTFAKNMQPLFDYLRVRHFSFIYTMNEPKEYDLEFISLSYQMINFTTKYAQHIVK